MNETRREAVVDALIAADTKDNDPSVDYDGLADAAIAALLPDIDAMQRRIAEALYCAYQTENGACDMFSFYKGSILYEEAMQEAHALIYGDDAPEQEGAEHDE